MLLCYLLKIMLCNSQHRRKKETDVKGMNGLSEVEGEDKLEMGEGQGSQIKRRFI